MLTEGAPKILFVSTGDRGVGYMAKGLKPYYGPEKETLCSFEEEHVSVEEVPPKGNVVDLIEREDQVSRSLGKAFSFKDHDITIEDRINWIWHWLGLEKHTHDDEFVQRNVRVFKFFMEKSWFHMCIPAEEAISMVEAKPSTFIVRLSRTKPGAISITLKRSRGPVLTHIRISPSGEDFKVTLEGVKFSFSKENLVLFAKGLIYENDVEPEEYLPLRTRAV